MRYCPECGSEYRDDVRTCGDCGRPLSDSPPPEDAATEELVEIFRCGGEHAAERVCGGVLRDMDTFVRRRGSGAFPAPAASPGQFFIAVEKGQAQAARELLAAATEDGVISVEEGEILTPEEA